MFYFVYKEAESLVRFITCPMQIVLPKTSPPQRGSNRATSTMKPWTSPVPYYDVTAVTRNATPSVYTEAVCEQCTTATCSQCSSRGGAGGSRSPNDLAATGNLAIGLHETGKGFTHAYNIVK